MNTETHEKLTAFYKDKEVLVTGGASFIGSHLVELLISNDAHITVVDNLSSGKKTNLLSVEGKFKFYAGDVRDRDLMRNLCQSKDLVFHLAADHGGRGYISTHPVESVGNMVTDHHVFIESAKAGVQKIIFSSSACVYPTNLQADEKSTVLLKESDAGFELPGTAFADEEYGWAKLMGELQLRAIHKQFGTTGVACRIFTAYGERENESHSVIALIAKTLRRMDPFPIWGDGNQTRNFTYIDDIITGLALAGALINGYEVVNLGTSTHSTINELIEEIFEIVEWRPEKIQCQMDKPVGVRSRASENSYCRSLLGWVPESTLRYGLRQTIEWYRKENGNLSDVEFEKRLIQRTS